MSIGTAIVICVLVGAFFGSLFTLNIVDSGWVKDCDTMGEHRILNVVYTCSLKEKAK